MKYLPAIVLAALAGCVVHTGGPGARTDVRVEADVHAHYRVIWHEYYGCSHTTIDYCFGLGWHVDDIAVALFLAHHARCDVKVVIDWRVKGLTWWDVTFRLGLKPDVYFVEIPAHVHVGPPYGKAYGYYRRHDPRYVFTDTDIHNLVHLKVTSDYYALDPVVVIRYRERGGGWDELIREHHGKSRGKDVAGRPVKQPPPDRDRGRDDETPDPKGPDKGPGKGKGKGK